MKALIESKIKAIAGAVVAALTAYIGTAITTGNALTAHGAELAAVGAVLTFLGVHQAPKNKPANHTSKGGATGSVTVHVHADTTSFRKEIDKLAADLAKVSRKG